jgi:hypothetical protein
MIKNFLTFELRAIAHSNKSAMEIKLMKELSGKASAPDHCWLHLIDHIMKNLFKYPKDPTTSFLSPIYARLKIKTVVKLKEVYLNVVKTDDLFIDPTNINIGLF